ncbi:MAG TPA: hypothetical protein VMQ17_15580 [Candidatus Sulfotelmatobacter sp.]|nr:hypothetical protein [Candidatus Sulfotelmatobacter sp.]
MVQVMTPVDLFVAEHATLHYIPAHDDCPDQAVLGISLDLLQTVLPAVLAFRPAGTFSQVQCGLGKKGTHSRFSYVTSTASDLWITGQVAACRGNRNTHRRREWREIRIAQPPMRERQE